MEQNKTKKGTGLTKLIVLAVLGLILFAQCTVITQPGEFRVIKQFGKIVRVEQNDGSKAGFSLKIPFIQSETSISNKIQLSDLAPSDVMTSDKKSMISDCFVLWRISDPIKFTQKLSGSTTNAESRISSNVYNVLKNIISSLKQEELISGRDGELAVMITEGTKDKLTGYGIEIVGVETKMLDLPEENKTSVYNRMISERNNIAASFTAEGQQKAQEIRNSTDEQETIILAQAQKQADTIIAEGQAEYMRILSDAYNDENKADFYRFVRQLDAIKASLKNGNNKIVLDKTSPIAELFY